VSRINVRTSPLPTACNAGLTSRPNDVRQKDPRHLRPMMVSGRPTSQLTSRRSAHQGQQAPECGCGPLPEFDFVDAANLGAEYRVGAEVVDIRKKKSIISNTTGGQSVVSCL
jgi:hypothetical protein